MHFLQGALLFLLRSYRCVVSPAKNALLGPVGRCRYLPTCSEYAVAAVQKYGPVRGGILAGRRLCRCHPWGGCGYDPVPESLEDWSNPLQAKP